MNIRSYLLRCGCRAAGLLAAGLLSAGLLLAASPLSAAELGIAAKGPTAETLVTQALEAELSGADRAALLEGAIQLDPNYAPARWQLGQVKVKDAWLNVSEVPRHATGNEDYDAYIEKRDALIDTAEEHRELARWCRGRRMAAEEKLHWSKVLGFEREDREALAALRLKWHQGRLLTREQIEASKREAAQRMLALRQWRPRVVKWRLALEGKDAGKRAWAERELARLKDAEALAALESVFATDDAGARGDRVNLALIAVAERIPQPEATEILLRRAQNAQSPAVIDVACAALMKRPLHAYVPQLIAATPDAIRTRFRVYVMPNGTVTHEHAVEVEKRDGGKQIVTYESIIHPTDLATAQRITPVALTSELNKASQIESKAAAIEKPNRELRERLQLVLEKTTGFEDVKSPELLAKQFAEYYGWSVPERSTEVKHQHFSEFVVFSPPPPPPGGGGECFAAGTEVMTMAGPRAIETLKAGDRVLAQDPKTGELEYKTVQERTLRMGAKVFKLKIGEETITATFGHPFWVVGAGWKVAGHLQVGDRLRGLEQDFTVEAIEETRPTEVYNLLVSDHATYFVGTQRLLVHDDSQVLETGRSVPGLLAKAK